jgi:integrase
MAKLTAKAIENVKAGPVRRELPDAGCAGLYLILQPSGMRSWAVRYRFNGKPVKLTLGQWPAMTLAAAREAAVTAQRELERGNNPAKAKADAKIKADAAKADTVTAICENYMKREGGKLRTSTSGQRESIFRRLIYPTLGDRPIDSIKRSEIVRLLDKIEDGTGPRMADVTLAVLRRVFTWHALRDDDFRSPIIRGMNRQRAVEHRRTRVLSDDEIRALWQATETPFSALIKFLLLTSARRSEAAGMCWSEIDADGIWTLPASRSKTKTEIVRPLSKAALTLIEQIPQIDGCPYVFTSTASTPIRQFSSPKAKLDAASGVTDWRLHDLRRTARCLLSRAGANSDIAERCLGHALPGIRATYDLHKYLDEMRHAFELLSAQIETIINPPSGEVADMAVERGKRQRR